MYWYKFEFVFIPSAGYKLCLYTNDAALACYSFDVHQLILMTWHASCLGSLSWWLSGLVPGAAVQRLAGKVRHGGFESHCRLIKFVKFSAC